MQYDSKGNPLFACPLSDVKNTVRAHCTVPSNNVIPVILLPGFMGSNLKTTVEVGGFRPQALFWQPDDTDLMKDRIAELTAADRQRLFNPETTAVHNTQSLPSHFINSLITSGVAPTEQSRESVIQEYLRRGWGEVYLGGYGKLLLHLEVHLNTIFRNKALQSVWSHLKASAGQGWGDMRGFTPLTDTDLQKAARYWYPVHAIGYNWLQSTESTALEVARRVDAYVEHYAKQGYTVNRVILVTHSMGGLVARAACHPKIGNMQSKVLGVIQGVSPTAGAPMTYRRMRAGHGKMPLMFISNKVADVLGNSAAMTTPVLGQSPGALELLPTKLYPKGWLLLDDSPGIPGAALPRVDPYAEIYRERQGWWRLINERLLDPAGRAKRNKPAWDTFHEALSQAEGMHNDLGTYHHPCTYVHYASAKHETSCTTLRWRHYNWQHSPRTPDMPIGTVTEDDLKGRISLKAAGGTVNPYSLEHSFQDLGDGTVPVASAQVSDNAAVFRAIISKVNLQHAQSYEDETILSVTLHNVAKISAHAT